MTRNTLVFVLLTTVIVEPTALANQLETPSSTLEHIVVTATKTARKLSEIPMSTTVFTEDDIKTIGARNLSDVFQNLPGVFINPNAEKITIRGVGGKGTLLLIDGRRIGSEYSFIYDTKRISANSIERIEVVKGPAGALYGSAALGGVINIITKKPQENLAASIGAQIGANTSGHGWFTQIDSDIRARIGNTGYSAWLSAQKAGQYKELETAQLSVPIGGGLQGLITPTMSNIRINPNNNRACGNGVNCPPSFSQAISNLLANSIDFSTTYQAPANIFSLGAQITRDVNDELTLKLTTSMLSEDLELNRIGKVYTSNYANALNGQYLNVANVPLLQILDNERVDMAIGADYVPSEDLEIAWLSSYSKYEKDDSITTPLWAELGYLSQDDSAALSGTGKSIASYHQLSGTWTPSTIHRLLIGVEFNRDKREAAFFSKDQSIQTKVLNTASLFAQHEWEFNKSLLFIYGVRYDDHSNSDDALTFNAGGVYEVYPDVSVRVRYAEGFRSPDNQELFMDRFMPNGKRLVGANVVDPLIGKQAFELMPEQSDNYEIGIQGHSDTWHYDIVAYKNRITDSLVRYSPSSASYFTFRNANKVDITGIEMTLSKRFNSDVDVELYASVLDSENADTNMRLEFTPDQQYNLTAKYAISPACDVILVVQHVGDQHYIESIAGQNQPFTADAYTIANLRINYTPKGIDDIDVYAGVNNLFDDTVDSVLGSDIGIFLFAGFRLHFE